MTASELKLRRSFSQQLRYSTFRAWTLLGKKGRQRRLAAYDLEITHHNIMHYEIKVLVSAFSSEHHEHR
ncbi:stAR-related lipid transfer protein 13-like isoform X3, partial [Clarias magur]